MATLEEACPKCAKTSLSTDKLGQLFERVDCAWCGFIRWQEIEKIGEHDKHPATTTK